MKKTYLFQFLLLACLLLSCDRDESISPVQQEPLVTKMSVGLLSPNAMPYNGAEMTFDFSYDSDKRLTKRTGGFLPISGSTGYTVGPYTKLIGTALSYTENTVLVENFSTSPDFNVQKNTRYFKLNSQNEIIEKEIPNASIYWYKKEFYTYVNGKLDQIITTLPNMPYDPSDPNDYIFTFSEKFYYDSAGNLAKTEYTEQQDGVSTGNTRVRLFENYDSSYNPFKRLILLDEHFYRSLSKNNFRTFKEVNQYGSTSYQTWEFNYDTKGNIIIN